MTKQRADLEDVVRPTVVGLGYELVRVEYLAQGKYSTLRVFISKPGGITLDDCEIVSRQLDTVLDVEASMLTGPYTLEVSSPGVDA